MLFILDTVFGNERHITYSADKSLKVETWKCEIEKVERCIFERTKNRELGMRLYFQAMKLATMKNY